MAAFDLLVEEGKFDMPRTRGGRVIETPTEARQAEPGPSVLLLLVVSLALAAILLSVVWLIFFRT